MLDAVDPGGGGSGDRLGAVGVGGDGQPAAVRFADGGAELGGAELGLVFPGAGGHDPAAGHQLDDVHAAAGMVTHRRPYALRSGFGGTAEEVQCPPGVVIVEPAATMVGRPTLPRRRRDR